MRLLACYMALVLVTSLNAQHKFEFDGQASAIAGYSPDATQQLLLGGRYIPELNYGYSIDSNKLLDFEASYNMSYSITTLPFDSTTGLENHGPYRLWARYSGNQFELRAGLQKIDFGSGTLLRPLQWFNQIDPRDPLQLTNGVYGVLGRYYFLNNANVWAWVLYGNENTRGFDQVGSNKGIPEYGGRVQLPFKKGELGLSYHHRTADSRDIQYLPSFTEIPENRIGIDAKFDLTVGLWFEATHIQKSQDLGIFTNQSMLNTGIDYTFGIGNGINMIVENLVIATDSQSVDLNNAFVVTAATASYPLGLYDNLSFIAYQAWEANTTTLLLNYQHQFKTITGYVLAYYNPSTTAGIQQNDLLNQFSGPGIRLMLVYNH